MASTCREERALFPGRNATVGGVRRDDARVEERVRERGGARRGERVPLLAQVVEAVESDGEERRLGEYGRLGEKIEEARVHVCG